MKTIIYTTFYPSILKYFDDFIFSINAQSFKDFKLFICLNGCRLSKKKLDKIKVEFELFHVNDTWQKARIRAIKKILKKKFKYLYFADGDDKFDKDRIKKTIKFFNRYDFVVNELIIFGNKITKNLKLFKRIKNKKKIKLDDIKDKNFIGCSNTAVKTNSLKKIIKKISPKLVAFDWCMATLLLINNYKGIFTNETYTNYRQYDNNTSGVNDFSKKNIINDFNVKINHYKYFNSSKLNNNDKIYLLKKKLKKIKEDKKYFKNYLKKKILKDFWWAHVK